MLSRLQIRFITRLIVGSLSFACFMIFVKLCEREELPLPESDYGILPKTKESSFRESDYMNLTEPKESSRSILDHTNPTNNTSQNTSATVWQHGLYDTPTCHSDALGAPEFVRRAGCNAGECEVMTCRRLLENDTEAMNAAKEFLKNRRRKDLSEEDVLAMASNCEEFRRRGDYRLKPVRLSDLEFPVAFNILIHYQLEQFERLLRVLYRPQNSYCIHVDAKASYTFHAAVAAIARCFDNVFVATRSQRIVYAGFSRLQADIDCMKDHLMLRNHVKWRYLLNVAGQSYPLTTPEELVEILRIYNGSNDIEGLALSRRLTFRYMESYVESFDQGKLLKTGNTPPPPPHNIEIVRGSAYGVFSRKFVEFVIQDRRAQDLLEWSRKAYSPDEHYWATLNHVYANPHLKTPGGYRDAPETKPFLAVHVKWYPTDECYGWVVRGTCVLGVGDLPGLLRRRELFVNKLYINSDPFAFECLEALIQQRVLCPVTFDLDFYRALPFVNH